MHYDFLFVINDTLLKEALEFASEFTAITEDEKEIIMHSKDTLFALLYGIEHFC